MLELIFGLLVFCLIAPVLQVAIRMSWGLLKFTFFILMLPVILIVSFIRGLLVLFYPVLFILLILYIFELLRKK